MGDCQNYGPLLGPYYNTGPNTGPNLGDLKRNHNFDNPPYRSLLANLQCKSAKQYRIHTRVGHKKYKRPSSYLEVDGIFSLDVFKHTSYFF